MPKDDKTADDIHPFSRMIFENMTDWVEGCLNDHIVYPEDGLDDDDYLAQRKYVLDEAEYEETRVSIFEKGQNKLDGLPELLEGEIICNESISGKSIGTIKARIQFTYNLDEEATTLSK